MQILITDAEERAALAAGRCLVDAGYRVSYAASRHPAPAFWSRSACKDAVHAVSDPRDAPAAFVSGLATILAAREHVMVMPGGDASLRAISQYRALLAPWVDIALPDHTVVEGCLSKLQLARVAERCQLGAPETIECHSAREAVAAARRLGYPVAVKPPSTVRVSGSAAQQQSSVIVDSASAVRAFAAVCDGHCLVQRHVSGAVFSFFGVAAEGDLLAFGMSRYRRTWPVKGGNVACATTLTPPGPLVAAVRTFVSLLGWEGVFELELLAADGQFMAIDFNPRLYGSLALAVAAGAALPAIWAQHRLTARRAATVEARSDVDYRWEDAELRHLLWQVRHGHLAAAVSVLKPRRAVHAHLRWDDPAPLVARALFVTRAKHRRTLASPASAPAGQPRLDVNDEVMTVEPQATIAEVVA